MSYTLTKIIESVLDTIGWEGYGAKPVQSRFPSVINYMKKITRFWLAENECILF